MKRTVHRLLGLFAIAVFTAAAIAQTVKLEPIQVTPDELTWTPRADGTSLALIVGDNTKPGLYACELRASRGFKPAPHYHPDNRVVVVVSGTFYVGFGNRFDEVALKAMPPGSSWTEPAGQSHFAWAKDSDVVLYTVGFGPSGTTWIEQ